MKKALAVLLVIAVALSIAACGGDNDGDNTVELGGGAVSPNAAFYDGTPDEITDSFYIRFKNSLNWSGTIYIYYWSDARTKMLEWPGEVMSSEGEGIYSYSLPEEAEYIIFNNNGGTDTQTRDIPFDGTHTEFMAAKKSDADGAHYVTDWNGAAVSTNDLYSSVIDPSKIVYTKDLKIEITNTELVKNYSSGFASAYSADAFVLTLTNHNDVPADDIIIYMMAYDSSGGCAYMTRQQYLKNKVVNPVQYVEVGQTYDKTLQPGESEEYAYKCDLQRIKKVETLVYSYAYGGKRYALTDEIRDSWMKKAVRQ